MGKYFEVIYTFHSLSDFYLLVKVSVTFCFLVTKDDFPFLLLFLLYCLTSLLQVYLIRFPSPALESNISLPRTLVPLNVELW